MASVSTTDGQDDFSALEAGIVDVNTEIESLKAAENPGAFQKLSTNIRGKVAALTMAGAALFGAANVEPAPQVEAADRVVAAATPNTANSAEEAKKQELIQKLLQMRKEYALAIDNSKETWVNILVAGNEQAFGRDWEAERKFTLLHSKQFPDQFGYADWTRDGKVNKKNQSRTYIFAEKLPSSNDRTKEEMIWHVVTTQSTRINKYNPYGVIGSWTMNSRENLNALISVLNTDFEWIDSKPEVVKK